MSHRSTRRERYGRREHDIVSRPARRRAVNSLLFEDPELGTMRLCRGCGESWPLDDEFWFFDPRQPGKVLGRCRACWSERDRGSNGKARFTTPLLAMPPEFVA